MATALLLDHHEIFRAVEGTLLRRENCRLLKAPASRLSAVARAERPDLILTLADDEASLAEALSLCLDRSVAAIPVLLLGMGRAAGGRAFAERLAKAASGRVGPVTLVRRTATKRAAGGAFDARLDMAVRRSVPALDRATDRIPADLRVRCEGRGLSMTLRTKNLSPSGLFLKTPRPLPRGRRFQVQFRLPSADPPVIALCEVVRLVRARGAGEEATRDTSPSGGLQAGWSEGDLIPGVGVRFVDMDERGRAALSRFVNRGGETPPEGAARAGRRRSAS